MGDWGLGDDTEVPDINIKRKCESCDSGTRYEHGQGLQEWLDGYLEWEEVIDKQCFEDADSGAAAYYPKCGYYNEELMTWDEVLQEDSRTSFVTTYVAAEDGSGLADAAAREDILSEAIEEWSAAEAQLNVELNAQAALIDAQAASIQEMQDRLDALETPDTSAEEEAQRAYEAAQGLTDDEYEDMADAWDPTVTETPDELLARLRDTRDTVAGTYFRRPRRINDGQAVYGGVCPPNCVDMSPTRYSCHGRHVSVHSVQRRYDRSPQKNCGR